MASVTPANVLQTCVTLNYTWPLFVLNPRALETGVDRVYTHPWIKTLMSLIGDKKKILVLKTKYMLTK